MIMISVNNPQVGIIRDIDDVDVEFYCDIEKKNVNPS